MNDKAALVARLAAAVAVAEAAKLETWLEALRTHALAVLIVSHDLEQLFRIADRVCVPRRGTQVATRTVAETDKNERGRVAMLTGVR